MSSHERLPSNITKTGSCAHSRFGGGAARRQAHLTQGSSRRLGWRQRSRRSCGLCASTPKYRWRERQPPSNWQSALTNIYGRFWGRTATTRDDALEIAEQTEV